MTRKIVRALAPYKSGTTILEVQQRYGLDRIIKLASNENPLGSSPKALEALKHLDQLQLYFDDAHVDLKRKLAARYQLDERSVVLGHGSNELVNLIVETFVDPGDEVVMALPSFLLYRLATIIRGGVPVEVPLRDGEHDMAALLAAVTPKVKLLFICDPNNPTGTAIEPPAWQTFLAGLPPDVTLVIDQAYREYMDPRYPDAAGFIASRPNTIVLRTMSKIYGLAGLRFGYGYADEQTIEDLERIRLPFNVTRPSALAAYAALDDDEFVRRSVESNASGKAHLEREFARLGLGAYPTQANFIAVAIPVSGARAYEELLARGIIVRSGDALNMPGRLRITIGTAAQNDAVIDAIEDLLPSWRTTTA